jgi:hypothetical protein
MRWRDAFADNNFPPTLFKMFILFADTVCQPSYLSADVSTRRRFQFADTFYLLSLFICRNFQFVGTVYSRKLLNSCRFRFVSTILLLPLSMRLWYLFADVSIRRLYLSADAFTSLTLSIRRRFRFADAFDSLTLSFC